MKTKIVTAFALTAMAALGVSAVPAQARPHHHKVCNFDHHHHRVCHWVG